MVGNPVTKTQANRYVVTPRWGHRLRTLGSGLQVVDANLQIQLEDARFATPCWVKQDRDATEQGSREGGLLKRGPCEGSPVGESTAGNPMWEDTCGGPLNGLPSF
jgi:hypothetical protein